VKKSLENLAIKIPFISDTEPKDQDEQLFLDFFMYGAAFTKDGKRIHPLDIKEGICLIKDGNCNIEDSDSIIKVEHLTKEKIIKRYGLE